MLKLITERQIEWGDCDPAGIVFNPNFYAFTNHSTVLLCEAAGWQDNGRAGPNFVGCPLVSNESRFMSSCTHGDTVRIESEVTDMRRSSFALKHGIFVADRACVEILETRVWCVRDADNGGIRSEALPEDFAEKLKADTTVHR